MDNKDQAVHFSERDLRRMNRRELLKLTPIIAMGAFALPQINGRLIKNGLGLSDLAGQAFFSRGRMAQTFANREVTPIEKFPVNSYSDYDPANDSAFSLSSPAI